MHDTGLDPEVVWRESKKQFWEAQYRLGPASLAFGLFNFSNEPRR
jgi:hypothetical protein